MEPRFESPIEQELFVKLNSMIDRDSSVELTTQHVTPTRWGRFRLDMLLSYPGRRVGIECDGKAFHDQSDDEWRDAMILGSGLVDEIIRLEGKSIFYHLNDCVFILSVLHPKAFSERNREVLSRMATDRIRDAADGADATGFIRSYVGGDLLDIRRFNREGNTGGVGREAWAAFYRSALGHPSSDLSVVRDDYRWELHRIDGDS